MKAEIIAIGTELLLGQIVNTNAQYLSQELAHLGIDVYFQTVVGDNEYRLLEAFDIASQRADLIVCTGGLGPTQDDLTKDVLATYISKPLELHPYSYEMIANFYKERGMPMVESNARQALITKGSDPLLNDVGMAVGIALEYNKTFFVLLPGPPREMKVMFKQYTIPWLKNKLGEETPLFSKIYKFTGIGESSLENQLEDIINLQQNVTIAPYAKEGEVALRLSTKALSQFEADQLMCETEKVIHERLGFHIFADQDISLEQAIVEKMSSKALSLACAESCTGGMLSDMITSISGSSSMFKGGFVCYSNDFKNQVLHIPYEMLKGEGSPGSVSLETTKLLAEQLLIIADTDYALSITGVAGPHTIENKPVGLIYIGLAQKNKAIILKEIKVNGNREMIKLKASKQALNLLWSSLGATE